MLLSLLLPLTSTNCYPILGALGRPANAWLLRELTRRQPDLAQSLHDDKGVKPYTVSTLLDDRGRPLAAGAWLQPGQNCWLRVTTFEQRLSEMLLEMVKDLPARLALYKMDFRLDGWTLDPAQHPWAGQTSFAALAQAEKVNGRSREVRLEFASPTAFRSEGADTPLPIPALILRSHWQRWNAVVPEPMQIHAAWPEFAAACVKVSELTAVNTERWVFAEGTRGAAIGFTGTASLALLSKHQCLKLIEDGLNPSGYAGHTLMPERQCREWAACWEGADRVLQSLAQFAFYCGTGHHTTIGMGQTRCLHTARDDQNLIYRR